MDRAKPRDKNLTSFQPRTRRYRVWDTEIPGFYVQVSRSGSAVFYYRYRWHGLARDYKLGSYGALTAVQARKLAKIAAGDVAKGIDVHAKRKADLRAERQRRRATLGAFIEDSYAPYLVTERKSGEKVLAQLKSYFGHWYDLPLTEITLWRVERWRRDQIKAGRSNGAINRPVTYLRACLNMAYRLNVIDHHPLQRLKRLKEDKGSITRYLSADEETRLRCSLQRRDRSLIAAQLRYNEWLLQRGRQVTRYPSETGYFDHLTPVVILAMNTGMRRGELLNLKWSHVDLNSKTLTVAGKGAKSSNTRHIPLCKEAMGVLIRWKRQSTKSGYVFPNRSTGRRLRDIKKGWSSVLTASGIEKFRFHDLRHHFASTLAMGGIELNTIRELLGHSTLEMTLRYAHLSPEHRTRAIAVLDQRETANVSESHGAKGLEQSSGSWVASYEN